MFAYPVRTICNYYHHYTSTSTSLRIWTTFSFLWGHSKFYYLKEGNKHLQILEDLKGEGHLLHGIFCTFFIVFFKLFLKGWRMECLVRIKPRGGAHKGEQEFKVSQG